MKRKITAIVLSVISLISIALVFTRTPILNIDNYTDENGKYFNYHAFSYRITKSCNILRYLTEYYSTQGDNYDKLKPYFDDVFEIRDEFSQNTGIMDVFTYTDEFYVRFLLSNGKFDEADEFCDNLISVGKYEKLDGFLHFTAVYGKDNNLKNWAVEKLKAIVESDAYQRNIKNKENDAQYSSLIKSYVWSEYAHALFVRGEYDLALSEIEKMANNKENGDRIIGSTLSLIEIEAEADVNAKEFIKKTIDVLDRSAFADSKITENMKERYLTSE